MQRVQPCRSGLSNQRYDAFALGSKGATLEVLSEISFAFTPKSSATRCKRVATSPDIAALADSTSRIAAKAARRSSVLSGNNFGMAATAGSGQQEIQIDAKLKKIKTRMDSDFFAERMKS